MPRQALGIGLLSGNLRDRSKQVRILSGALNILPGERGSVTPRFRFRNPLLARIRTRVRGGLPREHLFEHPRATRVLFAGIQNSGSSQMSQAFFESAAAGKELSACPFVSGPSGPEAGG